ncbi:transglutaminase superfamily protein [Luteibacter rhizovicinus]|uniref:Transglutaminase superfamily protein n=1 Tax=Luteibacter rhizovicinus TaxID=242606 RepID=A0A4R3YFG5_9GAMM|nr:transglutaminase-like domain-containing protein [Luteibacter rhizovicinus]TCV91295.1 transglutaminase superfamily protein [Luteibacter rhizovicinus]
MRCSIAVFAVLLCLVPTLSRAERTWLTVLMDGRKVGHLTIDRDIAGDRVTTLQTLDFRLTRARTPLAIHTEIRSVENTQGSPLAFYAQTKMSSRENRVEGTRLDDGSFQVANDVGGQSHVNLLIWPTGAALAEGQRLAMLAGGWKAGTRYQMRSFDAIRQQVADVDIVVVGDEVVDMPNGQATLHHLRQTLAGARSDHVLDIWLDDNGRIRRGISPLLGFRLEMLECDEHCAMAPDQDVDLLRAAMIESPRLLTPNLRSAPMRYIASIRGDFPQPFAETDEQHVTDMGDGMWQLDVGFARGRVEAPPSPEDTASNAWVQSDDPEIIAAAKAAVGDASSDLQRIRRLRSFVTAYIPEKGMDVGYASALETLHTHRGDCTEHAVLLAALARSQGIPTRVITGVVYADRFGGANRVFVPHAWVQVWLGHNWVSFDSAQRRYDATHLALGIGNGDPWKFFAAMNVLGKIRIEKALPGSNLMDMPGPSPSIIIAGGAAGGK